MLSLQYIYIYIIYVSSVVVILNLHFLSTKTRWILVEVACRSAASMPLAPSKGTYLNQCLSVANLPPALLLSELMLLQCRVSACLLICVVG